MNGDNNSYTIFYVAIIMVIVAIVLAFTAVTLRKPQQENRRIDKVQQILRAIHLEPTKDRVIPTYTKVIKQELLVNDQGEVIATFEDNQITQNEAFQMNTANQFKLRQQDHTLGLPVYVTKVDGQQLYILPMDGTDLWDAIWGFLVVQVDGSTVYGAGFSRTDETPGLGTEIATKHFSQEFVGKQLYCDGQFKSIAVIKHGRSLDDQDYMNGVSSGTLTSNSANNMLENSIKGHLPYVEQIRETQTVTAEQSEERVI